MPEGIKNILCKCWVLLRFWILPRAFLKTFLRNYSFFLPVMVHTDAYENRIQKYRALTIEKDENCTPEYFNSACIDWIRWKSSSISHFTIAQKEFGTKLSGESCNTTDVIFVFIGLYLIFLILNGFCFSFLLSEWLYQWFVEKIRNAIKPWEKCKKSRLELRR